MKSKLDTELDKRIALLQSAEHQGDDIDKVTGRLYLPAVVVLMGP